MACSPRVSNKFVVLALAGSMLATVKCDSKPTTSNSPAVAFASPLALTPLVTTSIVPQRLRLTPVFGAGCLTFPSLRTQFDLVVVQGGGFEIFLHEATIRLLDGTHLGPSPLLMSSADLNARFGSTVIPAGGRRIFAFDPQFGCGSFVPLTLGVDLLLLDRVGARHFASISVPVDPAR